MTTKVYRLLGPSDTIKISDELWDTTRNKWMSMPLVFVGGDIKEYGTPIRRLLTEAEDPATMQPLADTPINLSPLEKHVVTIMGNEMAVEVKEISWGQIIADCDEEITITFIIHSIRKNKVKDETRETKTTKAPTVAGSCQGFSTSPPYEGELEGGRIKVQARSKSEAWGYFETIRDPDRGYSMEEDGMQYTFTPFTPPVPPTKPKVESSKVPHFHLIPTVALEHIANRFEEGVKRKGDGAWNATTPNQEILMDKAFLIERLSHAINHALMLRDQLVNGVKEGEEAPIANASAVAWGGVYAITACQALFGENR